MYFGWPGGVVPVQDPNSVRFSEQDKYYCWAGEGTTCACDAPGTDRLGLCYEHAKEILGEEKQ